MNYLDKINFINSWTDFSKNWIATSNNETVTVMRKITLIMNGKVNSELVIYTHHGKEYAMLVNEFCLKFNW